MGELIVGAIFLLLYTALVGIGAAWLYFRGRCQASPVPQLPVAKVAGEKEDAPRPIRFPVVKS